MFRRKQKHEDQKSVNEWMDSVFGTFVHQEKAICKVCTSMADYVSMSTVTSATRRLKKDELDVLLATGADIYLQLLRAADSMGVDFHTLVDERMHHHRIQQWAADGFGTGYPSKKVEAPKDYEEIHVVDRPPMMMSKRRPPLVIKEDGGLWERLKRRW